MDLKAMITCQSCAGSCGDTQCSSSSLFTVPCPMDIMQRLQQFHLGNTVQLFALAPIAFFLRDYLLNYQMFVEKQAHIFIFC